MEFGGLTVRLELGAEKRPVRGATLGITGRERKLCIEVLSATQQGMLQVDRINFMQFGCYLSTAISLNQCGEI